MQIFLPYKSPLETAKVLDKRRLHKQLIECCQILDTIDGKSTSWSHHPVVLMYKNHRDFIEKYRLVLYLFRRNTDESIIRIYDEEALALLPDFISDEYCDNMKRRLYAKDPLFYKQFEALGPSTTNMYFVDGSWKLYTQK